MRYAEANRYPTEGSSALAPEDRRLDVLAGGRPHAKAAHQEDYLHEGLTVAQAVKALTILGLVLAALAITLILSDMQSQGRFEDAYGQLHQTTITVHEGDSLWTIAQDRVPDGFSTADTVRWISQSNSLDTALIIPGQQLLVPDIER